MKKVRRILAMILIMVMALTALPLTASAGIADTAKSITSGQTVTTALYNNGDQADYKINVTSSGTLKISLTSEMKQCDVYVFDANGNSVRISSDNISSSDRPEGRQNGDSYYYAKWNSITEKYIGSINYGVSKGTYYIRFERFSGGNGNGKLKFTATYPSTATKAKISYISVTMSKGSTLQLGAVVSPSSSKVKWTSSKTSVATVSSSGKITAKAKGATIITAKSGTSTKKIRIVVK